jgi:hypothetical protein
MTGGWSAAKAEFGRRKAEAARWDAGNLNCHFGFTVERPRLFTHVLAAAIIVSLSTLRIGGTAMARDEEPREDLLREATALVERVELQVEGFAEPIVAGFRRDGAASFYFGQDISYQFNTAGQLRRAYFAGRLYKAEGGRLVQLTRRRTADETALLRHECDASEEQVFLSIASQKLSALQQALVKGCFHVLGQLPPDCNIAARVGDWLSVHSGPIPLACSPHAN